MVGARFGRGLDRVDAAHACKAERTTAIILLREGSDDFVLRRHLPGHAEAMVLEVFVVVGHPAQIGFVEQCMLQLVKVAALYMARRPPPSRRKKDPQLVLLDRPADGRSIVVRSPYRNGILQAAVLQRIS